MNKQVIIEKSKNDKREYEYLKLLNNLQCVIVKDVTDSMCGACLNVNVGSVNEKIEGLAHFLEHMVFMGSKKYPDSNDFMSSINKNGGSTNAYTSDTDTNYHFTISPSEFMLTLDKFAQFFTHPLLKEEYVDREINNVDSECKKNLLDDMWIQMELYKTIVHDIHPINHFSCGDVKSLKIDNIYQELKKFHDEFYDAKYMTLVIFTNDDNINNNSVENIKKIIYDTFGMIKTDNTKDMNRLHGKILKDNMLVKYVPQREEHYLTVLLEGLTQLDELKTPYHFLTYILGNELEGSLHEYLLNKGYITRISVSEGLAFDDYTVLNIECILTDLGLENYKKVYNIIVKYIQFVLDKLKNNDEQLSKHYLELMQTNKNNFEFWEKDDIIDTMISLTNCLKEHIPKEYILSYDTHLTDYNTICDEIKKCLENYSIGVSLGSKKNSDMCKKKFPRYNVLYENEKIDLDTDIISDFTLPILNKFICYNLEIDTTIIQSKEPMKLDNDVYNSFYYGDVLFKTPMTDIRTIIKLPNILTNVESYVAMVLYLNSAYGDINELKEMAQIALYKLYIKLDYDTLYILLSGYTEKIDLVVDLIRRMFHDKFRERSFKTAHYELCKNLKNYSKANPLSQLNILFEKEVYAKYYTPEEQWKVCKEMTMDKCIELFRQNYTDCRVNILTIGNLSKEKAINLNDKIYESINVKSQAALILTDNINRIGSIVTKVIKTPNKKEENTVGSVIYDLFRFRKHYTKNWKAMVLFSRMYTTVVANKYFYELRTKKQMGYIVRAKILLLDSNYHSSIFLQFVIQSPKYSVKKIIDETTQFITNENNFILDKMTVQEYEKIRDAERTKLKKNFISLGDIGSYFMNSILDESYKFDVKESLLKKLDAFNFEKFKKYVRESIMDNKSIYYMGLNKH
jgi:insulysin